MRDIVQYLSLSMETVQCISVSIYEGDSTVYISVFLRETV